MTKIAHQEAISMISNTPVWSQKAVFVAILAENMLLCYEFFYHSENWGNPDVLKEAVDLLRRGVFSVSGDLKQDAMLSRKKLYDVAPDLDDFEGGSASYGLDSCVVIDEALSFIDEQSGINIERIVNAVFDTLDMYIQEKENLNNQDPDLKNKIDNDPFMVREIERQVSLISFIRHHIGEKPSQSDYLKCQEINARFGPFIDLKLLPY